MEIRIISAQDHQVSQWNGGSTTQLYIYPELSDFSKKEFDFRISSATIEVEESSFTPFPNYSRKLMILEGVLDLFHTEQYGVQLHPFDQDVFSGDWMSHSKGKVIDFNVIYNPKVNAELFHFELSKQEEVKVNCDETTVLYVLYGEIQISQGNAKSKDVILVKGETQLKITAMHDALIVVAEMNKIKD